MQSIEMKYRIIPNKRTTPNKGAPPFSCTLYIQSAGLKNLPDTSLLRVAVSTWLSHGQRVVSMGVNALFYCYM